jgi:hypothetical protein
LIKNKQEKEIRNKVKIHHISKEEIFSSSDLGHWYGDFYNSGFGWWIRVIWWVQTFGKEIQENVYDNYLSFCNMPFVTVPVLLSVLSASQREGKWDIGDPRQNTSSDNDKVVLVSHMVKGNPFPMLLNNKHAIRVCGSTGMWANADGKFQVLTIILPLTNLNEGLLFFYKSYFSFHHNLYKCNLAVSVKLT